MRVTRGPVASAVRALDFSGRSAMLWPRRPCRLSHGRPSPAKGLQDPGQGDQGGQGNQGGEGHRLLPECLWSWDLTAPPSPRSCLQLGDDTLNVLLVWGWP